VYLPDKVDFYLRFYKVAKYKLFGKDKNMIFSFICINIPCSSEGSWPGDNFLVAAKLSRYA